MGKKIALVVVIVAVGAAYYLSKICSYEAEPPTVRDGWYGRGSPHPDDDVSIRPFKVEVPEDILDDLDRRLASARLGEDLEGIGFEYGFQVNYMKEVIDHWRNKFDWREQEKVINKFPHYKTKIEGLDVHFIHVKPTKPLGSSRPIMIIHGWPGSVWEFYKMIPMLTDPVAHGGRAEDAFEVICPSIPGYGFSEAPHQTGFNALSSARIFVKLMERLGHKKFYVQGGDWGGLISTFMSQAYPSHLFGAHMNMYIPPRYHPAATLTQLVGNFFPSLVGITPEEGRRLPYPLSKMMIKLLQMTGYMHLQATKPDTVAFGLNDSPVGLAAYILEKFSEWTDRSWESRRDGGMTEKFTMDELLTNVMIYWVTGSIGSSVRFYKENFSGQLDEWDSVPAKVPTGLANYPNDMVPIPKALAETRYKNIIQYTLMSGGGHFAAMEDPRTLADDIISFVKKVEQK